MAHRRPPRRRSPSPLPSSPSNIPPPDQARVASASSASPGSVPPPSNGDNSTSDATLKQRVPHLQRPGRVTRSTKDVEDMPNEDIPMSERPMSDGGSDDSGVPALPGRAGSRNKWVVLAIASGACAAFNGVFAKLATGDLTSSISRSVAHFLHLSSAEVVIEAVVRVIFFGLNLAFNGIMWTLFTQALAKGNSTTQVSIINTSSNFTLTAVLGLLIFSESLPPLWWLGASMLVAGSVIVGRKDEGAAEKEGGHKDGNLPVPPAEDGARFRDDADGDDSRLSEASSAAEGGLYRDSAVVDRLVAAQLEKDDEDVPHLGPLDGHGTR